MAHSTWFSCFHPQDVLSTLVGPRKSFDNDDYGVENDLVDTSMSQDGTLSLGEVSSMESIPSPGSDFHYVEERSPREESRGDEAFDHSPRESPSSVFKEMFRSQAIPFPPMTVAATNHDRIEASFSDNTEIDVIANEDDEVDSDVENHTAPKPINVASESRPSLSILQNSENLSSLQL